MLLQFLALLFLLPAFAGDVRHEVIPNAFLSGEKVEFFWAAPEGSGHHVFIMVHGHQGSARKGGALLAQRGALDYISSRGMIAVAVSQSGHGQTTGEPDHAGKNSQAALRSVIAYFRNHPRANPSKIFLYGTSMGATLSALTAAQEPGLAGIILENGMYDVKAALQNLWFRSLSNENFRSLYQDLDAETDGGYAERSAILFADEIKVRVFLLAGLGDDIALPEQSLRFHERLVSAGGNSEFILYPFAGHNIPEAMKGKDMVRFLWNRPLGK